MAAQAGVAGRAGTSSAITSETPRPTANVSSDILLTLRFWPPSSTRLNRCSTASTCAVRLRKGKAAGLL
jgi:hypothetical protein